MINTLKYLEWTDWFDSYAVLVSDYLTSAVASQTSGNTAVAKSVVTSLTSYLLTRLGHNNNTGVLTSAILALVGGEPLTSDTRSSHQQVLTGACPEHVLSSALSLPIAVSLRHGVPERHRARISSAIGTNDKIDLCVRAYQTADSRLGVPFAIKACFSLLNFHIRLQPQNEA